VFSGRLTLLIGPPHGQDIFATPDTRGAWTGVGLHYAGEDVYYQFCDSWAGPCWGWFFWFSDFWLLEQIEKAFDVSLLSFSYSPSQFTAPGCGALNFDLDVSTVDFEWMLTDINGGESSGIEYNWPNGGQSCVGDDQPNSYGTYSFIRAKKSDSVDWMLLLGIVAVILPPQQPSQLPPHPVNFRQALVQKLPNGVLHFEYTWESSTGRLADLQRCVVGELVRFDGADPFVPPNPPWVVSLVNPGFEWFAATGGPRGPRAEDNHTPWPFSATRAAATVTAHQTYRYACTDINGNTPVTLRNYDIVRSVKRNQNGSWRYEITKNGVLHSIDPIP
jgi:hypothetical protein